MAQPSAELFPNNAHNNQATRAATVQSSYPIPRAFRSRYQNFSNLSDFRNAEGKEYRKKRLQDVWTQLPRIMDYGEKHLAHGSDKISRGEITSESARSLEEVYSAELLSLCGAASNRGLPSVSWEVFKKYAEAKETELWHAFHDLDLDGNGCLDARELSLALDNAGIKHSPMHVSQFIAHLNDSSTSTSVTFSQFRDFLLLLPRKPSIAEIYQYYNVKNALSDAKHPSCTNADAFNSRTKGRPPDTLKNLQEISVSDEGEDLEPAQELLEEGEPHSILGGDASLKFLLAGGFAGAVSRTCTAPFDRLKVFLITRPPSLGGPSLSNTSSVFIIKGAIGRIYAEGGVLGFWTGNGLSVAKIFPESAIKFFTYESAKRAFANYWDRVDDPCKISGTSRFLSGGLSGLSSQLSIYPIETLKTQMMSDMGQKRDLVGTMRQIYSMGGIRAFYRGLTAGLIGVFPYAAIDMSTFEALKLAYIRSSGKEEPGVLALLSFGSISGSVGATSVYPLNLVRTCLQASGSPGHPDRYTGVLDVAIKTWERDGWRGFYRGLLPSLAKVVPSVSISYVVYEHSKRKLGV